MATLLCPSVCCTNSSSPALMRSNRLALPTIHPVLWNAPFFRVLLFIRSPLIMGVNMACGTEYSASSCCLLIHASEYRCRSRSHRSSRPLLCVSCPLGRDYRLARRPPSRQFLSYDPEIAITCVASIPLSPLEHRIDRSRRLTI